MLDGFGQVYKRRAIVCPSYLLSSLTPNMYNAYGHNQGPAIGRHPSSASSRYSQHGAPPGPPPRQSYHASAANYGPPGVPPGADPELWSYFSAVDADHSQAIDVNELQAALVNGE